MAVVCSFAERARNDACVDEHAIQGVESALVATERFPGAAFARIVTKALFGAVERVARGRGKVVQASPAAAPQKRLLQGPAARHPSSHFREEVRDVVREFMHGRTRGRERRGRSNGNVHENPDQRSGDRPLDPLARVVFARRANRHDEERAHRHLHRALRAEVQKAAHHEAHEKKKPEAPRSEAEPTRERGRNEHPGDGAEGSLDRGPHRLLDGRTDGEERRQRRSKWARRHPATGA